MNDRLLDAYYEYCIDRVRAGIIDHALDAALLDGKTEDEHIVEVLRAAGRLPEGWDRGTGSEEPRNEAEKRPRLAG